MRSLFSRFMHRFGPRRVSIEINDQDLALAMQLGFVEKFMGGLIITDKGLEAINEGVRVDIRRIEDKKS